MMRHEGAGRPNGASGEPGCLLIESGSSSGQARFDALISDL
jgi:hypothetical protein